VLPGKDEEARGLASLVREQRIPALVIDTELDFIKLGLAQGIAEAMGAACLKLDDLRSESLAQAVRLHAPGGEAPLQTPDQMLAMARQVTGPG
jgi:Mg-chelatase subunit ChlD